MPGCRTAAPLGTDADLSGYVPADTVALAAVRLDQLRASPLYADLPAAARAMVEPLHEARYLLVAWDGKEFLAIARGSFREAPPGATLAARDVALAGTDERVRAAVAQHRTGGTGAPDLLAQAAGKAAGRQIWMAARGSATLPFEGNADNVNRLLHATQYTTVTAQLGDGITVDATAVCGSAGGARRLEETLRALFSLAAAGSERRPQWAALLSKIEVSRDDRTVRAAFAGGAREAEELLRVF